MLQRGLINRNGLQFFIAQLLLISVFTQPVFPADGPAEARKKLLQGEYTAAVLLYRRALAKDPRDNSLRCQLAAALLGFGDLEAMERELDRVDASGTAAAEAGSLRAALTREKKARKKKEELLLRLKALDDEAEPWPQLQTLVRENPTDPRVLERVTQRIHRSPLPLPAQELEQFVAGLAAPDHWKAPILARLLLDQGRYDDADPILVALRQMEPDNSEWFELRRLQLVKADRRDEHSKLCREWLRDHPASLEVRLQLLDELGANGKTGEQADLLKDVNLETLGSHERLALFRHACQTGNNSLAVALLDGLAEPYELSDKLTLDLARQLVENGNFATAWKLLSKLPAANERDQEMLLREMVRRCPDSELVSACWQRLSGIAPLSLGDLARWKQAADRASQPFTRPATLPGPVGGPERWAHTLQTRQELIQEDVDEARKRLESIFLVLPDGPGRIADGIRLLEWFQALEAETVLENRWLLALAWNSVQGEKPVDRALFSVLRPKVKDGTLPVDLYLVVEPRGTDQEEHQIRQYPASGPNRPAWESAAPPCQEAPLMFQPDGHVDSRRCIDLLNWFTKQSIQASNLLDSLDQELDQLARSAPRGKLVSLQRLIETVLLTRGLPEKTARCIRDRIEAEIDLNLQPEILENLDRLRAWLAFSLDGGKDASAFDGLIR